MSSFSSESTYLLQGHPPPPSTTINSILYEKECEANDNSDQPQHDKQKIRQFYVFICISTALRAFEAGIVSGMLSDIQLDLDLNYTQEGTVTASPDFGIAPGALLAIFVFGKWQKNCQQILIIMLSLAGAVAMLLAVRPTYTPLLIARALGGLTWAHAATHYPVWIDRRAPFDKKTLWLAGTNICLLGGVIGGYLVGGATRIFASRMRWIHWYGTSGVFMMACALVVASYFDADLVNIQSKNNANDIDTECNDHEKQILTSENNNDTEFQNTTTTERIQKQAQDDHANMIATINNNHAMQHKLENDHHLFEPIEPISNNNNEDDGDNEPITIPVANDDENIQKKEDDFVIHKNNEDDDDDYHHIGRVLVHLFQSPPFVLSVAITGCISGGIVFALYFAAQAAEARGISASTTFVLVMVVFVTAPAPGVALGSWLVHSLGGYTDHVSTFQVALGSAVVVLAAAAALPISWSLWGTHGTVAFVAAFWIFAFAGAMAGPPMNGVAVSAVPHASHVASAIQFAIANASKIVVPQLGGFVCNRIGLIAGFHLSLVITAAVFVVICWMGLVHAQQERKLQQQHQRQ